MSIERVDHTGVLEAQNPHRQTTMAVNLRPGETLELAIPTGVIVVEMVGKHGLGGRIRIRAPRSVPITTPESE